MELLSNPFSLLALNDDDNHLPLHSTARNRGSNGAASSASGMELLSNPFSLLTLNDDDNHLPLHSTARNRGSNGAASSASEKNGGKGKNAIDGVVAENGNHKEYKLPLVWIDLEMTGLNVEVDRILEIACIITDGNLTKSVEGPDLVVHQPQECLDKMGEWCQKHHGDSGLTRKVQQSTITEREAEKQVITFVKKHIGTGTALLAGNSVYMDFLFLKKYMPELASLFSHVVVDVSSVRALCIRWYPRDHKKAPVKEQNHRAMDDIRESIAELKYLKGSIFKPKSK